MPLSISAAYVDTLKDIVFIILGIGIHLYKCHRIKENYYFELIPRSTSSSQGIKKIFPYLCPSELAVYTCLLL